MADALADALAEKQRKAEIEAAWNAGFAEGLRLNAYVDVLRLKEAQANIFANTGHGIFGGYVEALAAEYDRLGKGT